MIWAPSFTTRSGPPIDHHQGRATNTAPAFNHVQNYRDTLLFSCPRQAIVMSRIARVVVSAIAHHVTQRGNRCWRVFFVMRIMSSILTSLPPPRSQKSGAEVWAWCVARPTMFIWWPCRRSQMALPALSLTPTGAILGISMPATAGPGTSGIGIWLGDDGRGASGGCGGLCYRQSGARAGFWASPGRGVGRVPGLDLTGVADGLTTTGPMLSRFPDFTACLAGEPAREAAFARLRRAEQSGRPRASPGFVEGLEQLTARLLTPQRRGPKPRSAGMNKG